MLPVANRPLLEYVIEALAEAGIEDIILVVGYQRDRIQTYFADGNAWDVNIEYVVQDTQLGTGHAVKQLEGRLEEPFLVLNGDRLIESELITRVQAAASDDVAATVGITRVDAPQEYGVVSTDGDALVAITEKPGEAPASEIINAGVYQLSPRAFDAIDETGSTADGEIRLPDALTALADEAAVNVARYNGLWIDTSQLWDLLVINDAILGRNDCPMRGRHHEAAVVDARVCSHPDTRVAGNATVGRGTSLGSNVTVGPGAVIRNSIVLPDVTIEAGAVVQDCILGEDVTIGANATVAAGRSSPIVDGVVHEDVPLGAVIGDYSRIGDGAVIQSGTIIGDDTTVADGAVASGRIETGTTVLRG
jgi:glucose-1-phosphate thymidylyltransferase